MFHPLSTRIVAVSRVRKINPIDIYERIHISIDK